MVQKNSGWSSDDGSTFKTRTEAVNHDLDSKLKSLCESHQIPYTDKILPFFNDAKKVDLELRKSK